MIYSPRKFVQRNKIEGREEVSGVMKWIVFALGLVLVAGGLAAIWQGYDIIEVERGLDFGHIRYGRFFGRHRDRLAGHRRRPDRRIALCDGCKAR